MWFEYIKGRVLLDTENDTENTFSDIYNVTNSMSGATSNAGTSGAVAVPITELYSGYTTNATAAIAGTLADGYAGQIKVIKLELKATNNLVVTPANFADGTTITFDATGEIIVLIFDGSDWQVVYKTATVA